jgi:hypothetical protein
MEIAAFSDADRSNEGRRTKSHRSRVTNGALLAATADGRSAWARRLKDVCAAHLADLGGETNTSAAERSLIRRIATLTVELELLECRFAVAGEATPEALDLYSRAAGNLRRLLEAIGLQRRAKPVPSLQEYLAALPKEASP